MINSTKNAFGHETEMVAELKKKLEGDCDPSSCVDEVAESFSSIEFDKETIKKIDDLDLYEKHLFDLEGRFTILVASDLLRGLIYFYNKDILTQSVVGAMMEIGSYVETPRFLKVRIDEVFESGEEARRNGYTEPTHYVDEHYNILGKNIALNRMIFAGVKKMF